MILEGEKEMMQKGMSDYRHAVPLGVMGLWAGVNPRDGGAWWAAVYGVAQSRIRLKDVAAATVHF